MSKGFVARAKTEYEGLKKSHGAGVLRVRVVQAEALGVGKGQTLQRLVDMEGFLSFLKENCEDTEGWKQEDSMVRLEFIQLRDC